MDKNEEIKEEVKAFQKLQPNQVKNPRVKLNPIGLKGKKLAPIEEFKMEEVKMDVKEMSLINQLSDIMKDNEENGRALDLEDLPPIVNQNRFRQSQ